MYLFQLAVRSWQVAQNDAKAAAMCGSPLERVIAYEKTE